MSIEVTNRNIVLGTSIDVRYCGGRNPISSLWVIRSPGAQFRTVGRVRYLDRVSLLA
jgi:hypothetical protein